MGYALIKKKSYQEHGLNTMVNMVVLVISVFCLNTRMLFSRKCRTLLTQNFSCAQCYILGERAECTHLRMRTYAKLLLFLEN